MAQQAKNAIARVCRTLTYLFATLALGLAYVDYVFGDALLLGSQGGAREAVGKMGAELDLSTLIAVFAVLCSLCWIGAVTLRSAQPTNTP